MSTLVESKKLGLGSMILLGINSIIGSGIFLLPGQVAALAGQWSLCVYGFVSLLVLAIAWCFAQCATIFTRNGGSYIYAKEAFGDFIGFEIGFMRWAVGIIAWASIAVGFATALGVIWPPALKEPMRHFIVIGLVGGLGLINICGVKMMKGLNNIITIAKIVPLLLFVGLGIFFVKENYIALVIPQEEFQYDAFGSATLVIFYAFGGFEALAIAAQEMKNPTKNIPLAVMIVVAICSFLYVLIQFISIGLLGPALAFSTTPIADAAELLVGSYGKWLVMLTMLISIGGVNIACSFIIPRSGVALAEDALIPPIIARQGRYGTPSIAILITVVLTCLVSFSGNFTQLVAISVVSRFAQYISTCLAIFVFRYRLEALKGPLRYTIKLLIPILALSGVFWLLFQASFNQIYWGLGGLVIGIPLYLIQKRRMANSLALAQPKTNF